MPVITAPFEAALLKVISPIAIDVTVLWSVCLSSVYLFNNKTVQIQ